MTVLQFVSEPFNLVVAGSRSFNQYELTFDLVMRCLRNHLPNAQVVCGEARGADYMGRKVGEALGLNILSFPADWDRYGKSAGYRRNVEMAEVANGVLIFWDGVSRGSKHMLKIARRKGLPVVLVRYDLLETKILREVITVYEPNNKHSVSREAA